MSPFDDPVEIEVAFDEDLLAKMDRLSSSLGYETRSDVVVAALAAKE